MAPKRTLQSRRSVLKSIGGGAIAAFSFPSVASASNKAKYTGVAYDLTSHEIVGESSGQLTNIHNDLVGNLRVNGVKKNMNKVDNRGRIEQNGLQKSKHIHNSKPGTREKLGNKITMTSVGQGAIGGYIQEDGVKTGFSLTPKGESTDWKQLLADTQFRGEK